jgi:alpha-D-xyloside xylohydrolase
MIERSTPREVLRVEPWGPHAVRVRSAPETISGDLPGALDLPVRPSEVTVTGERLINGRITVEVDAQARLRFLHTASGRELLADKPPYQWHDGPRWHHEHGLEQHFRAYDGERIYGLGQNQHGRLDQKGLVLDLVQRNTTASIPFLVSSRGYGVLWNNPAVGRVELAVDATRWVAEHPGQIDYWITAGDTPAEILSSYADATGHPPLLPEWASGFWQSKLRYRTQEELLEVAREYARRGLPLSAIVADYFHWAHMGDWHFDPEFWPDPRAMLKELDDLGTKLVVSVWPTVEPGSANHRPMAEAGLLVKDLSQPWPAKGREEFERNDYYDATHPDARRYLWERLREHYGNAAFWLDACEPDVQPGAAAGATFEAGPGRQVANMYAHFHARGIHDGLTEMGETRPLSLVRCAWAGTQRYGVALWSGDIRPTFDALATQIRAGLNAAMSGIPWWNTDIGGFAGGDPEDPAYREIMIRWFQFGTFSPIMRLHGVREPSGPFQAASSGAANEVWSYGEQAYHIMRDHLALRERLRPYLHELSRAAHESGAPVMRPLFFDFPEDERAWTVDEQYLLGPDLLVAPVTAAGVTERPVYLPSGSRWRDRATGELIEGGVSVTAASPIERIPVFVREGSSVEITA